MFARLQVNGKLMPIDRGELEDNFVMPYLEEHELGEVVGGGTAMGGPDKEIEYCDIELELTNATPERLRALTEYLDAVIPRGSTFTWYDEGDAEYERPHQQPIGTLSGLGLYLNGTDLPDEVYATSDINQVIGALEAQLESSLRYWSHWRGPTETALYFYGTASFAEMQTAIAPITTTHPLCQKSRVVAVA